jgi:ribosomal protein S18 acetylase RimI-like enzyme
MASADRDGLVAKQTLTPAEIAEIRRLAELCDAHDQATIRVNWDSLAARPTEETNDFFYYRGGQLIGVLSLYVFGRGEAEASGMVHPEERRQGIFRMLTFAGVAELHRRDIPKLIFFCDHQSSTGIATLEVLGAQYGYAEYRMDLDVPRMPATFDERLRVERAGAADVDAVAQIIAQSFGILDADVRQGIAKHITSDTRRYYLAWLDGSPIGALNLILGEDDAGIYGFGVVPEQRGRGYGRQILALVIQAALAEGPRQVFLEVAPENDRALGLYQSVGFRETKRYDYYILGI